MKYLLLILTFFCATALLAQNEEALLKRVRAKLDKVSDYQADGRMRMDVSFIKAPASKVIVYYKRPNLFKVKKAGGISILPKGGVSVNVGTLLTGDNYQTLPGGNSVIDGKPATVVKLIPSDEASDVVLSVLHIDEQDAVIRKATVTTKESGTYEIVFNYGAYIAWGLPDKVVFSFNTKDYKMPKGVVFEYEKGGEKKVVDKAKAKKGKVEIAYLNYVINKGVKDINFQ